MNPQETRAAISLALVYVLRMLGLFMVIPVLAIAAVDYPDYSPLFVGLAIGGYGLTQAILQIPMGVLSDKWGRKPVIYMGLCFFALGSLVAANADSMAMLTLGRILQGAGAIAGAIMALAADVTRESTCKSDGNYWCFDWFFILRCAFNRSYYCWALWYSRHLLDYGSTDYLLFAVGQIWRADAKRK